MIDHNFYASPVQASQTLITHILEAMDKELERPFTIALSGGTTPATLFEVWEREYAAYTPWSRIYLGQCKKLRGKFINCYLCLQIHSLWS